MDKPPPQKGEESTPAPPLLYRYRPLPDKSLPAEEYKKLLEREKRIFTERELYFSSPAKFNDPFDCRVEMLQFPENPSELRKEGLAILKTQNPGMPRQQLRALMQHHEKANTFQKLFHSEQFARRTQTLMNSFGVLCLSKTYKNILMWSHYTNGHRGFCLVFPISTFVFEPYAENPLLVDVIYYGRYPCVPVACDPDNDILHVVFRAKSSDWEYEKEWRVIWRGGSGKKLIYPEGSLVGVILGCWISEEHRRLLFEWTKVMDPRPKLIQSRRKQKEFGLDFFLFDSETGQEVPFDPNDLIEG